MGLLSHLDKSFHMNSFGAKGEIQLLNQGLNLKV